MAVGMMIMTPGGTKEQYDQVNEKMWGQSSVPAEKMPEGLILHSAGPAEGGWYIYDVWESKEAFQRFFAGPLGKAVGEVFGDGPPPPGSEPRFFEIESLAVAK